MSKKTKLKTIFLVVLLLVFLLILYFSFEYWKHIKEGEVYFDSFKEHESIENYIIRDTLDGKMVINENVKLSFIVPQGWDVEKIYIDDVIEISSPDKERYPDIYGGFMERGCVFWLSVDYYIQRFSEEEHRPDLLLKQIQGKKDIKEDVQEVVFINNLPALKAKKISNETFLILIEIPIDNRIYNVFSYSSLKDKDFCSAEFNVFLETVSISI